ncbi:hypothetical protein OSTOST_19174 [Ostertagia ostertagi]
MEFLKQSLANNPLLLLELRSLRTLLHSSRIAHDAECIRKLFDFLSIDCTPITSYRMGKPNEKSPRLIKVVLQVGVCSSKRAPRLKTYQSGGVSIIPPPSSPSCRVMQSHGISPRAEEKARLPIPAYILKNFDAILIKTGYDAPPHPNVVPLHAVDASIRQAIRLHYLLSRFDVGIVAICETWLKSKVTVQSLLGELCSFYNLFRCDRKRKKGGGVLLLVKQSFCPTLVFSESVADGYEIVAAPSILLITEPYNSQHIYDTS